MVYQKKNLGSYQLHLIKTKRFKTITFRIVFRRPIKKEEITMRNVLNDILTLSCEKYKTKRELAIYEQDLYGAYVESTNSRLGNYMNTSFYLTILNEKYTEEGMLEKSVEFLHDILFHPNVKNGKFDENAFDYIKNMATTTLNSIKENTSKYSLIRLLEVMEKESPLSYRSFGYVEDLSKITRENLYTYYLDMINNDMVDIFVLGDIDFSEMTTLIQKYFDFSILKKVPVDALLEDKKARLKPLVVKEQDDIKQAKLALALRMHKLTKQERNYAVTLFNVIFGGGSDSKLFQEVREKNSLAYTVASIPNKLDNLILVTLGIDQSSYDLAVKIIKRELKNMQKGNFSEEDITKARELYITAIDEASDVPLQIIDSYYMMELLGTDDLDTKKTKIKEVTKQDIITVAKKVKIDTIYLLEGQDNEENEI